MEKPMAAAKERNLVFSWSNQRITQAYHQRIYYITSIKAIKEINNNATEMKITSADNQQKSLQQKEFEMKKSKISAKKRSGHWRHPWKTTELVRTWQQNVGRENPKKETTSVIPDRNE